MATSIDVDVSSASPRDGQPKPPSRARMIVVLGALVALGPLTIDMYLPALPKIADDLSVSSSVAQLTLTGTLAGLALGQLIVAHARQRLEALRHGARLPDPIQELGNALAKPIKGCRRLPEQVVDCKSGHDDVVLLKSVFVGFYIVWYYIDFTVSWCIAAILRCMPM